MIWVAVPPGEIAADAPPKLTKYAPCRAAPVMVTAVPPAGLEAPVQRQRPDCDEWGSVSGAPTDPTVCAPRSGGQWGAQIVVNEECAALRKIMRRVACWYLSHVSLCASESERILRQRGFQVWPGDAALRV